MTVSGFAAEGIELEKDGAVGTLWLNRPEKRNALSRALWGGLPAALEALHRAPDVRVIVLAGRGRSFCVGIDLADLAPPGGESAPLSAAQQNLQQIEFTRSAPSASGW